jgi:ABC-type spermidine/putrescine transport system permease subunit II
VLISGLLGVPAAYAMARRDFPGRRLVMLLFLLPLLVPPMTFGIPLATVLYQLRLGGTFVTGLSLCTSCSSAWKHWKWLSGFIATRATFTGDRGADGLGLQVA